MSLRNARLLQLAGLIIAAVGLVGFWLNRDIPKTQLSEDQLEVLGIDPVEKEDVFRASFVVAGRDYDISSYASPCRYVDGECIRDRVGEFRLGNRTDTIMFVQMVGDTITMINIPRDIWLPQWQTRINAMYGYQGAEGLKESVEDVIGLPIDYYAVISIDIFEEMVDALGGVDVNIPVRMYHRDAAADLTIDFQPGPAHLDGEDASHFVRYRDMLRGDIDRIDNVKRLAYAMLSRVKELNVRTAFKAPELIEAVFSNMETNASPALVTALVPRINKLQLQAATLPFIEIEDKGILTYDAEDIEAFLAETFGGEARSFTRAPEVNLLITNRSGVEGLETLFKERLVKMGIPKDRLITREASVDPSEIRILTTSDYWQDADYYTSLFGASKQQIDRFESVEDKEIGLELVLGEGAGMTVLSQKLGHTTFNAQLR